MKLTVCVGSPLYYYNKMDLMDPHSRRIQCHQLWKVEITRFCSVLVSWNVWYNTEFSIKSSQCYTLTECSCVWSVRRAPNIHQRSLTCADTKLSLNSPLSRKGALASSSLLTCVMIEADGWSMRSVKQVKSQLKMGFRIKIFPLATIELKKKRKDSLQMPPKLQKTFTT